MGVVAMISSAARDLAAARVRVDWRVRMAVRREVSIGAMAIVLEEGGKWNRT